MCTQIGTETAAADLASGSSATNSVCKKGDFAAFCYADFGLVCPIVEVLLDFNLPELGGTHGSSVFPLFRAFRRVSNGTGGTDHFPFRLQTCHNCFLRSIF